MDSFTVHETALKTGNILIKSSISNDHWWWSDCNSSKLDFRCDCDPAEPPALSRHSHESLSKLLSSDGRTKAETISLLPSSALWTTASENARQSMCVGQISRVSRFVCYKRLFSNRRPQSHLNPLHRNHSHSASLCPERLCAPLPCLLQIITSCQFSTCNFPSYSSRVELAGPIPTFKFKRRPF